MIEAFAPHVVHARVDAWVFGFRVRLAPELLGALEHAAKIRAEHGTAEVCYGPLRGALSFSAAGRWLVRGARYDVHLLRKGPGVQSSRTSPAAAAGESAEPGWTVEVKWRAQGAADLHPSEVYPLTRAIAEGLGERFESRLRRVDLCADVAGFDLREDDAQHFVKRSRARLAGYAFARAEGADANDLSLATEKAPAIGDERVVRHWLSKLTGFTVCPGGTLTARIYDKRTHLQLLQPETRDAEESRWREGGWSGADGEPITRVEFQLRGEVLDELGIRDPERPFDRRTGEIFDGVHETFDRIWRACIEWLSLRLEDHARATRRTLDPRWAALYAACFVEPATERHGRMRVRGGASVEQGLGCAISITAARDCLERRQGSGYEALSPSEYADRLAGELGALYAKTATITADHLVKKWGAREAYAHVGIVIHAALARFADPLGVLRARASPKIRDRDRAVA